MLTTSGRCSSARSCLLRLAVAVRIVLIVLNHPDTALAWKHRGLWTKMGFSRQQKRWISLVKRSGSCYLLRSYYSTNLPVNTHYVVKTHQASALFFPSCLKTGKLFIIYFKSYMFLMEWSLTSLCELDVCGALTHRQKRLVAPDFAWVLHGEIQWEGRPILNKSWSMYKKLGNEIVLFRREQNPQRLDSFIFFFISFESHILLDLVPVLPLKVRVPYYHTFT